MGYERNIDRATEEVLSLPDVRDGIDDPSNGLNNDFVRARVRDTAEQIFQSASSPIEDFEQLEKTIETSRAELARLTADPRDVTASQIVLGLTMTAAIFGGPIALATIGITAIWATLLSLWVSIFGKAALGLVILMLAAAGLRIYYYNKRTLPALQRQFTKQLGLETADDQLSGAKARADAAVREETQKSILGLIADASQPLYQDRLFVPTVPNQAPPVPGKATTGRGLSEVVNSANEVPTAAYSVLLQMFENLPGASIGICGPRGAGKSTLLSSICGSNQKVAGREAIAVHTAAPVEYDSRDFMLHIFSCVCQQVLKTKGVTDDRRIPFREEATKKLGRPLIKQQARLGWLLVWLGAAIIVLSLMFASIVWDSTSQKPSPPAATAANGSTSSNQPAAPKDFVEILEIKPGQILPWGAIAIVLGLILVVSDFLGRMRELYSDGREVPFPLRIFVRPDPPAAPQDALAAKAQEHLHDIRFQRSYSSGWSGALKIPAGFELGETLGTALAQRQESFPELVDRFRSFVTLITREYSRLIVGIDELDKLKSENDARKFINGIKAIFNLPNCFYVVSVSENAISNFERRGLPFRDEFDSAFDDILRVDYLTLGNSRHLLGRRVLNLPEGFLCLCHVLSAGLPRDLIRVTRAMLEYAKTHPQSSSITEIAEALVTEEAARKVRAIEIAAREISLEPNTTEFLREVTRLRDFQAKPGAFSKGSLAANKAELSELPADDAAKVRRLMELRRELDTFLYFSVTTVEFFAHLKSADNWSEAIGTGLVERLGRARQAFELNVGVAEIRLDELRQECGLAKVVRRGSATKRRRPRKADQ